MLNAWPLEPACPRICRFVPFVNSCSTRMSHDLLHGQCRGRFYCSQILSASSCDRYPHEAVARLPSDSAASWSQPIQLQLLCRRDLNAPLRTERGPPRVVPDKAKPPITDGASHGSAAFEIFGGVRRSTSIGFDAAAPSGYRLNIQGLNIKCNAPIGW